jgi:hypothetical protein
MFRFEAPCPWFLRVLQRICCRRRARRRRVRSRLRPSPGVTPPGGTGSRWRLRRLRTLRAAVPPSGCGETTDFGEIQAVSSKSSSVLRDSPPGPMGHFARKGFSGPEGPPGNYAEQTSTGKRSNLDLSDQTRFGAALWSDEANQTEEIVSLFLLRPCASPWGSPPRPG